jgi:hypothetical protein
MIRVVHRRFEETGQQTGSTKIPMNAVYPSQNTVHLACMDSIRVFTGLPGPAMIIIGSFFSLLLGGFFF